MARILRDDVRWRLISQIRTLSVDRIGKRIAHASEEELSQVVHGLNEILG